MPNRHLETAAAILLSSWTDSDTTMQIVGTSLGLFGPGLLDPTAVLAYETPMRNALFDVLLSLVEGGALEMRATDDAGYAFRWRTDFATAALTSETSRSIDIDAPSPYLDELVQARRERDDALGRADFAEALAAERERQLRVAEAPRVKRPVRRTRLPAPAAPEETPRDLDLVTLEAEEPTTAPAASISEAPILEAPIPVAVADAVPTETPAAEPEAAAVITVEPEPVHVAAEPAPDGVIEVDEPTAGVLAGLPPEPEIVAAPPRVSEGSDGLPPVPVIAAVRPAEPDATAAATVEAAPGIASEIERSPAPTAVAKKAPHKKAAPKKRAKKPAAKPTAVAEPQLEPPSEVVYLTPPVADDDAATEFDEPARIAAVDDSPSHRAKWSGYTLDKPRAHLSSVDRIADDG